MGFTPKSDKPFPPPVKGELKEWVKKYFDFKQGEGEHYSTEIKKVAEQYENGHPDYVSPLPSPEDTVTLTRAQLENMFADAETRLLAKLAASTPVQSAAPNEGLKDVMSDLADILNPTPGQRHRARTTAEIDRNDYLAEPVMFFTYKNYYSIHSETRYSHEEKTPYGRPIVFQNVTGHITGNPRGGKQTVQISAAQIQTKKELEWMRSSPKFNVVFFEKMKDVMDIDPVRATHLAQAMAEISSLSEFQVTQRAAAQGIQMGTDVEQMRRKLIEKMAKESMDMEMSVSRNAATTSDATLEATLKRGLSQQQGSATRVMSY
jgi:hypothetical protein